MNAKVTIKFAGLLLLRPGAGDSCEVGIHNLSDTHSFQAMVIVSKPNRPASLVRMVTGPLTSPFAINVTPAPATGVRAFALGTDPLERNRANDERDFRWALDVREMQGHDVDFNDGARPVATLSTGTLYTSNLTHKELNPELVRGSHRERLHRFSADLAAAIELPYRSRVELTWDEGGEMRELRLPRRVDRHEPKTTYTVVLLNDPPLTNTAAHDELDYYYEVLEHSGGASIGPLDRYHMSFNTGPTTDEIPCMPVIINQ